MTLQEKFKQWLDTKPREQIRDVQLEVIADDFAIGFAEWVNVQYRELNHTKAFLNCKTTSELLQIYKKEKGL